MTLLPNRLKGSVDCIGRQSHLLHPRYSAAHLKRNKKSTVPSMKQRYLYIFPISTYKKFLISKSG